MTPKLIAKTIKSNPEIDTDKLLSWLRSVGREFYACRILEYLDKDQSAKTKSCIYIPHKASEEDINNIKKICEIPEQEILDIKIDEKIIGGFKVEFNWKLFDASTASKIRQLKKHIASQK